jgi:hypothetical protein
VSLLRFQASALTHAEAPAIGSVLERLDTIIDSEIDHWAEDLWVGRVLGREKIRGHHDYRYTHGQERGGFVTKDDDNISVHLSRGTNNYDPDWMREVHRVWKKEFSR